MMCKKVLIAFNGLVKNVLINDPFTIGVRKYMLNITHTSASYHTNYLVILIFIFI